MFFGHLQLLVKKKKKKRKCLVLGSLLMQYFWSGLKGLRDELNEFKS